jgi:hypothetical protein
VVLRFTLDTTCVIAMAKTESGNPPTEVEAIAQLIDMARDGRVQLQLTAAYDRDFDRYRAPEGRSRQMEWLSNVPIIEQRASGLFVIGVSVLDGPDVIASDEEAATYDRIRSILDPGFDADLASDDPPASLAKRTSDTDHLIAHWRSGATAFVTLDSATILVHERALQQCRLTVCWPSQAVTLAGAEHTS